MSSDTLLVVLVAIVMVIGVGGTIVLPILPGLWLIWAAALGYGLFGGFGVVGWVTMALITSTCSCRHGFGRLSPQQKAASVGRPWWGQLVALVCAVAGFFIVPVVGAPLGFVVGILLVTLVRERHLPGALAATWATLKSLLLASGLQFAVGLAMVECGWSGFGWGRSGYPLAEHCVSPDTIVCAEPNALTRRVGGWRIHRRDSRIDDPNCAAVVPWSEELSARRCSRPRCQPPAAPEPEQQQSASAVAASVVPLDFVQLATEWYPHVLHFLDAGNGLTCRC